MWIWSSVSELAGCNSRVKVCLLWYAVVQLSTWLIHSPKMPQAFSSRQVLALVSASVPCCVLISRCLRKTNMKAGASISLTGWTRLVSGRNCSISARTMGGLVRMGRVSSDWKVQPWCVTLKLIHSDDGIELVRN